MPDFDENKKASMDDMENVTGGSYYESIDDVYELWKRGFFSDYRYYSTKLKDAQDILHRLGYTKCRLYEDHQPYNTSKKNYYADKNGKTLTRKDFWDQFEEEFI